MTLFFAEDDIAIRARQNGLSVFDQIKAENKKRKRKLSRAETVEADELERKARFRASWIRMVRLAIVAAKTAEGQRDIINCSSPPRVLVADIIREVCDLTGISALELKSARKTNNLVRARFYIAWRARKETSASFPQIGRYLGRRDHTTVLHGVRQFQAALDRREPWAVMLAGAGE